MTLINKEEKNNQSQTTQSIREEERNTNTEKRDDSDEEDESQKKEKPVNKTFIKKGAGCEIISRRSVFCWKVRDGNGKGCDWKGRNRL